MDNSVGYLERIGCYRVELDESDPHPGKGVDPDWGRVPPILSRLRNKIELEIDDGNVWGIEDVRGLSRVIRMNPMMQRFDPVNAFPFESTDTLCSALATVPALERVSFAHHPRDLESEERRRALSLVNPESLTEVLQLPSLRSVGFRSFYFTKRLCRAVAVALKEGSARINTLNFNRCSFLEQGGAALIASALKRNETVTWFRLEQSPFDEAFCDAMAVSLLTNATLRDLTLDLPRDSNSSTWLSSLFLALGMNTGLNSLNIRGHQDNGIDLANEDLCGAMENGLGKKSMLESLHLRNAILSGTDSSSGHKALSFLRTNTTIKLLTVFFKQSATESRVSVFRTNAASMLENNTSLEKITMSSENTPPFEDYVSVVSALQPNTTLTYLALELGTALMTDDQASELTSIIKKNYGLQRVTSIHPILHQRLVDLHAILRLNRAGRRYLVNDGSSISKGVDVLSAVSDDINCLFLHLSENPRLCDRGAVERMSLRSDGDRLPNATDSRGKRESMP
jgi:hypothetical protein